MKASTNQLGGHNSAPNVRPSHSKVGPTMSRHLQCERPKEIRERLLRRGQENVQRV